MWSGERSSCQSPSLTIVHCPQTFIVTPPPEPATAAAACPAAQKTKSRRLVMLVRHDTSCSRESSPDLGSVTGHTFMPRVDEIGCRRPQMIPGRRHVLKSTLLSCILRSRAPRRYERDRGRILVERGDAHGMWVFRRCNGEHGAVL